MSKVQADAPAKAKAPAQVGTITLKDLKKKVKAGSKVLWVYREKDVEEGDVIAVRGNQVDLIWLEGYKSRNDTVQLEEILSVHDESGPEHSIFPFTGKGFITDVGMKWNAEHPRD